MNIRGHWCEKVTIGALEWWSNGVMKDWKIGMMEWWSGGGMEI